MEEANSVASSPHTHFHGLDTLRSCAILMVIPCHAVGIFGSKFWWPFLNNIFPAGWIGVDLFFVLSGFLIGSQLLQGVKRTGRVEFPRFYFKRSMRILPAYLVVLLLYYIWPAFREAPEIESAERFILFYMNYGRHGDAFSHAWSLCVEEHFYLTVPMIIAASVRWPRILRPVFLVAGALVGVVLVRYYLWGDHAKFYPDVYRKSHTHLDGLTVGLALALIKEYRESTWTWLTSRPWMMFVAGIIMVGFGKENNVTNPLIYIFSFSILSAGFGCIVISALSPGFWLAKTKIPGAKTLATLAFTLYLTHKQMIHMAKVSVDHYMDRPVITLALAVGLSLAASAILYLGVERPFLKLRDRFLYR